jgi:lipopolysaccharide export system permease protein
MRLLDRYILFSLLKITLIAVLLLALMIVLFDTFSNLDRYLDRELSIKEITVLTVLFIPQAVVYSLAPSLLFATTYFLAMLHANNEMIILSNSGYPYRRIVAPLIALGIFVSIGLFFFSEYVRIPANIEKETLNKKHFGSQQLQDNLDITLQAYDGSYVIHAQAYYDSLELLSDVNIIFVDERGNLIEHIKALSATYNGSYWVFKDVKVSMIDLNGMGVQSSYFDVYENEKIDLESALFRNLSAEIDDMELYSAIRYLRRIKVIDKNNFQIQATQFYNRILTNLNPLLLIFISSITIFNWKKSVLVLSILASLAIAIVYYVLQMVSMIMAKQSLIAPLWGTLTPIVLLLFISTVIYIIRRI